MVRYSSLEVAFYARCPVERPADECWEWQGTLVGGYGQLRFGGSRYAAHRVSYELHKGPIPEGLYVCHACDNRACVNPAHLWLGTNEANMQDKLAKNRQAHVIGRQQGTVKLHPPQVLVIRRLVREGVSQQAIARRFGISQSLVSRIASGKAWKHLSAGRG